jgi:hypothetical protein
MASNNNLSYHSCNQFGMIDAARGRGPPSVPLAQGNMKKRRVPPQYRQALAAFA